jgi:PAS domain S-box-containing protein
MNKALHVFAEAPQSANLLRHWYALLDHIPTGVYICDRDGLILRYNARAAEIWGWSPPPGDTGVRFGGQLNSFDVAGNPLDPSDWPVAAVLRTGMPAQGREIMFERRDGVRLYILVNADPLFDENGELIGAVNCIQDITAQKRAELREAQDKRMLEAVIETTPECIKLVAADGTLLQINTAGCDMIGAPAAQLIGASIFDVIAPDHRDHWRENHTRVCAGEKLSWEFDLISANGRRSMETHAAPLTMPDGARAHLAVTRDVTSRKAQEHELREQKQRLQDLLEGLPAAVYTTDAEGRITFFNQASVDMAGRVPRVGEDLWCVTWKLFKTDGMPLPHDQCPMAVALKENRAVRGEEAVAERPDGTRVPFIPYPTPIRDASGNLVGAINMLVDISERKQAEYRQRILLDELNHRVKNNLQMLHSLLRTAQRESNSDEAKLVLEDAAHRIGAIAAAQRVLYSAESATSFSTNEFLQAVCHAAQQAFAGDVKIHVAPSTGDLSNEISMPLALVLNELLTNAVKHGLKGRRHGSIKVQLSRVGERYDLTVEDDGSGFELRPSSRRSSGLGLVAGLARQLGGTFEVQRSLGARCIVSFPENRNVLH